MRILVIEDEPQLARHVIRGLARHGHDASVQHDGAAGLEAAGPKMSSDAQKAVK